MDVSKMDEAARQEAIRRGLGPRIADWFVRGAHCAATGQTDGGPSLLPTRAWWKDGVRWFEQQAAEQRAERRQKGELERASVLGGLAAAEDRERHRLRLLASRNGL